MLVGSSLDPSLESAVDPIEYLTAARLLEVPPSWRELAIADLAYAVAQRADVQPTTLATSHRRLGELLEGVDRQDLLAVRARLGAYADGDGWPDQSRRTRLRSLSHRSSCHARLKAVVDDVTADPALRRWIAERLPRLPRDRGFCRRVRWQSRLQNEASLANRKRRSDPVYLSYDENIAVVNAHFRQSERMMAETLKAHREADRRGSPDHHYAFECAILDADGQETGHDMMVRMRSVTIGEQIRRLRPVFEMRTAAVRPSNLVISSDEGGPGYDPAVSARRIAIYEGVTALSADGPPARPPFMVEAFRTGAAIRADRLPAWKVEERSRHLARTGIGTPNRHLNVDSMDDTERRIGSMSLVLLNEVVIPVVAQHRCTSEGRVAYLIAAATGARSGTMSQVVDDPSGWLAIPLEGPDRQVPAILATPKMRHRPEPHPIGDKSVIAALTRHVELMLAIEHDRIERPPGERDRMPVVAPPRTYALELPPARYLLQMKGVAHGSHQISYCMRWALQKDVVVQEVRDAGSTLRGDEGATTEQVGHVYNQRDRHVTVRYMKRGEAAAARVAGQDFLARRDAISSLGSPTRPGGS